MNTTKYILHVYKLNYNEDWQEEHVYRTAQIYKPQVNITEEQWFSNFSMVIDKSTSGKLLYYSCNL